MIVSTEREQHQQWLNGLKIEDEVAIYNRYHGYAIHKVTKITPTRRFSLSGTSTIFSSDGIQMGNKSGWGWDRIEKVTEKVKEDVVRRSALYHIGQTNFKNLSTQQLLDVLKIIHGDSPK